MTVSTKPSPPRWRRPWPLRVSMPAHALLQRPARLPWPLPALLAWSGGWALWMLLQAAGVAPAPGFALALSAATALALGNGGAWRRAIAAAGFPLSALALGAAGSLSPWVWLLPALPLLALYPLRAWRDAPWFPTPADALAGLDAVIGHAPGRVLDAGCGLGHGLRALHRLWPQAACAGVEWSPLLAAVTGWCCRWAQVQRGDMWAGSWAGFDVVYVFQRPESMARAFAKARRELAPGAWLVSLEFEVPEHAAVACLQGPGRRPVWVYQPVTAADAAPAPSTSGSSGR